MVLLKKASNVCRGIKFLKQGKHIKNVPKGNSNSCSYKTDQVEKTFSFTIGVTPCKISPYAMEANIWIILSKNKKWKNL